MFSGYLSKIGMITEGGSQSMKGLPFTLWHFIVLPPGPAWVVMDRFYSACIQGVREDHCHHASDFTPSFE